MIYEKWFMVCVFVCVLGYGGLSLSIEGPSKVDINTEDQEDGTCKVTYCPTEPGNYIINIKFADQHVPGRPPPPTTPMKTPVARLHEPEPLSLWRV